MGAINIEKGKVEHRSKNVKMETWKHPAFLAAHSRLANALIFSITLPILSLFVAFCTPYVCIKFNTTHARDWIRMGLSLLPHLVISIVLIYHTLPIIRRPLLNKQKWKNLAEFMEGIASGMIYFFVIISILMLLDLCKLHDISRYRADILKDASPRCVGILMNWIAYLLLTLLTVRVNYDQTRVALLLEALDILEWTGQRDGEYKVVMTNSVMKSYCDQMKKINELLCPGMTVAEMADVYIGYIAGIDLWNIIRFFIYLYLDGFSLNSFVICICAFVHLIWCGVAKIEAEEKKISIGTYFIIFCQLILTGIGAYFIYLYEPNLKEFVLRSARYWNGHSQPLSVPNTMWEEKWTMNHPRPVATMSLYVMGGSIVSLFLIHSIYTLVCYVIKQSPVDSAKDEETREFLV